MSWEETEKEQREKEIRFRKNINNNLFVLVCTYNGSYDHQILYEDLTKKTGIPKMELRGICVGYVKNGDMEWVEIKHEIYVKLTEAGIENILICKELFT